MSSGTYFPKPVKAIEIPKTNGGIRVLGVPTVEDRIAQAIAKIYIEPKLEELFYEDSYGYRANKSQIQAIETTRKRCWERDWVLEFDVKGLFDNISHEKLMNMVRMHVKEKWILLYIKRWLEVPFQMRDGTLKERKSGTPQGGVISALL
jgi:group II intron reverse transcriptase/maturase